MKVSKYPLAWLIILLVALAMSAACGPTATRPPVSAEATLLSAETATPLPTASPPATPAPPPTVAATMSPTPAPPPTVAAPLSPTPAPLITIPPTAAPPTPSPTADLADVGLPCPASPQVKPDYVRYVLSVTPWPTPDPAAEAPPLSLSDPLPAAGRNTGYPYGSDGSGRYLLHNGLDMADENDALAGAAMGMMAGHAP